MPWTDALKNLLLSGETFRLVLAGGFGAWVTIRLQRWSERKRTLEETRHRIYDMLGQLMSSHAWIMFAEIDGKDSRPEQIAEFYQLCRNIRLALSKAGKLPETEDILRAIHDVGFPSEVERSRTLLRLFTRLGQRLNPYYAAIMEELQDESKNLLERDPREYLRRFQKIVGPVCSSSDHSAAPPQDEQPSDTV